MEIKIQKAERKKARIRIEIASASWSGKTYSSLLLAKWLVKGDMSKVCMIDTENWSGHLYSHLWDYSVIELQPDECTTENILKAFKAIEDSGFEVIIWDSSSMRWDILLKLNDDVAKKMNWNSFRAWWKVTPLYDSVIQHMLSSPCHVIVTARKKQDWAIETNDQWKSIVKKVGMKDVQRDTLEYEMSIVFNLDQNHLASASKDRTWLFDWKDPEVLTEETGKQILDRCESGAEVIPEPKQETTEELPTLELERFRRALDAIDAGKTTVDELIKRFALSQEQKDIINEKYGMAV